MRLDEWVAEMNRFPSVYGARCLEVISTSRLGPFINTHFTPYPKVWGRGAYTVRSLKEAKQMAIDFSKGVS